MNEITTDAALLRRYAKENSEAAFAELVRRHLDLVYSAALRRLSGDAHRAADVAQQVFIALARDAQKLSRHAAMTAWLYTATRNAAIDCIRSEHRRATREKEAFAMQTLFAATPEAEWEKLHPVLDEVMDELSVPDRTAVLMRFFEKRPFAEIGVALKVGDDAARMRVDRALEKLRGLLAKRGVTSTAAALGVLFANQAVASAPAGLAASITSAAMGGMATVGVATTTKFFATMSTTKSLIGVTSLIAVLAIGTAVREFADIRETNAALAALTQERASLERMITHERRNAAEADSRVRSVEERLAAVAPRTTGEAKETSGPKRAVISSSEATKPSATEGKPVPLEILSSSPEYQQLAMKINRAEFPFKFGPLYRLLNLSPSQIGEFENILLEQSQSYMDMMAAARAQGMLASDPSLTALRKSVDDTFGKKMVALLGGDGAKQFFAFYNTAEARTTVDALAGNLYYTEAPLTLVQADKLALIISANTSSAKMDGLVAAKKETNWNTVLAQAQNVLTGSQFATFQAQREREGLKQQMSDLAGAILRDSASSASSKISGAGKPP